MLSHVVDPTRKYEINGQVCTVTSAVFSSAAGVANKLCVTAISGKVIGVMGWILNAGAAGNSNISFKDGSGGGALSHPIAIPADTSGTTEKQEIVDSIYFKTTVSVGLYADINANGAYGTVFYIAYTP